MNGARVVVNGLRKTYRQASAGGQRAQAVHGGLLFNVEPSEFVTVFGPNGSGKTTLLKILAGLDDFDKGTVLIDGEPPQTTRASVGLVFQEYDLFDWMTVRSNVEFGMKAKGIGANIRRTRAQLYIDMVKLTGHEDKYPSELSGGMKQRTAIARALAIEPDLLLLDEPSRALDASARREFHQLIQEVWQSAKRTTILISHDIEEAILLSDRILVVSPSPAVVTAEFRIDLPRPRNDRMRFQPAFLEYLDTIERFIGLNGDHSYAAYP